MRANPSNDDTGKPIPVQWEWRKYLTDFYHFFLVSPWWLVLLVLLTLAILVNAIFAWAYWIVPGTINNARPGSYSDAFFFSVQTIGTIGYGGMTPNGLYANLLTAIEALLGLISLAMASGLMFAKFSRPTAKVIFSNVAVIAPRDGKPSLIFRMANARANRILEAQVRVVFIRTETTLEGETLRKLHDLELSRDNTPAFRLTWTAVHPITESSPLYGQTPESLRQAQAEIFVTLIGMDDIFAAVVHARHHYRLSHILWGRRFTDILTVNSENVPRIDFTRFHDTEPLPALSTREGREDGLSLKKPSNQSNSAV